MPIKFLLLQILVIKLNCLPGYNANKISTIVDQGDGVGDGQGYNANKISTIVDFTRSTH